MHALACHVVVEAQGIAAREIRRPEGKTSKKVAAAVAKRRAGSTGASAGAPAAKRSRNIGIVFASGTSHPPGRDKSVVVPAGDAGARRFRAAAEAFAFVLLRLPPAVQAQLSSASYHVGRDMRSHMAAVSAYVGIISQT